ncbi:MAG: tRNA-modifying enzyme [Candidatus Altiarchaeales archaeon IMC4]|nr:MAG: tRNA-modifying enzyme [Candidatus Altiarchaeales archaeon IMC4]
MVDPKYKKLLERQNYKVVGNHSAVKVCAWTKKSIRDEGVCYKEQFYGIECHRCLQMTPAVASCTQKCLFCWRSLEHTESPAKWDDPSFIIENSIEAQRKLLSGFGGNPDVNKKKLAQAQDPNQAAISLSGEPTIYPKIDELVGEFNRRRFTTFLVTNGTLPGRLSKMENLPTQLYLSVDAPNEEIYRKLCNPLDSACWGKLNETMDLFPSLGTRRVIRMTMVKGWNMVEPQGYAKIIGRAQPDFVEVKAYMFVGASRERLTLENMPSNDEVMDFAQRVAEESGYDVKDEKRDSRVVLLGK